MCIRDRGTIDQGDRVTINMKRMESENRQDRKKWYEISLRAKRINLWNCVFESVVRDTYQVIRGFAIKKNNQPFFKQPSGSWLNNILQTVKF